MVQSENHRLYPLRDVRANVTIQMPDGESITFRDLYDKEETWRIRFKEKIICSYRPHQERTHRI